MNTEAKKACDECGGEPYVELKEGDDWIPLCESHGSTFDLELLDTDEARYVFEPCERCGEQAKIHGVLCGRCYQYTSTTVNLHTYYKQGDDLARIVEDSGDPETLRAWAVNLRRLADDIELIAWIAKGTGAEVTSAGTHCISIGCLTRAVAEELSEVRIAHLEVDDWETKADAEEPCAN
jgi:hypothetical protein